LNLSATATANTSGNGNISISDCDADVSSLQPALLLSAFAGSGTPVDNTTGNLTLTQTGGSIGIHPVIAPATVTASNKIVFTAQNSIVQLHGEVISAPTISLTATTGNIGVDASLPFLVSSGASGTTQLNLSATATANTPGNGNISISDSDADVSALQPAVLLTAFAGSGTPVDNTTGVLTMIQTGGSIGIHPVIAPATVTASNKIVFTAQNSIVQLHGEVIAAPTISLTALTGNIGVDASLPFLVSSGASGTTQLNLSATATANTSGNGNISISDS